MERKKDKRKGERDRKDVEGIFENLNRPRRP
jgi:hypothetical protein